LLLVLLRVAIGWHFLYEGLLKLESFETDRPFRAEAFLRQSTGPFGGYFRSLVEDEAVDDPYHLKSKGFNAIVDDVLPDWDGYLERFEAHYALSDDQSNAAFEKLEGLKKEVETYFDFEDPARIAELDDYKRLDAELKKAPAGALPPFEQQLLDKQRDDYQAARGALVGWLDDAARRMRAELRTVLTNEQLRKEPLPEEQVKVHPISRRTAWLLTLAGAGMMLGLFSRVSCLAAAAFLAMVYLAMPPWPGLPANPLAEGNYMIVSKNLIEVIAALMLATTPSGRWAGLDALIHGLLVRPLKRLAGIAAD
jgi:uncharacterized membrane protein YphA (DoxX/SURF4 family)